MAERASGTRGAGLRGKLPDSIALPASVTVPFGSFEEALKDGANRDVARRLQAAVKAIPATAAEAQLAECRDIVMEVPPRILSSARPGPLVHAGVAAAGRRLFCGRALCLQEGPVLPAGMAPVGRDCSVTARSAPGPAGFRV